MLFALQLMATGETGQPIQNVVPHVVILPQKYVNVNVTILNLEMGAESAREKRQKLQSVTFQNARVRSVYINLMQYAV